MSALPTSSVFEGWTSFSPGDYVNVADPSLTVRVVANSVIGLINGNEVTSYLTSGVHPHKVRIIMEELEALNARP